MAIRMTYYDPILGDIELKNIGTDTKHIGSESVTRIIFVHERTQNFYIQTLRKKGMNVDLELLPKDVIDMIINGNYIHFGTRLGV